MDLLAQQEACAKWAKLIALTNSIRVARGCGERVVRPNGKSHMKYTPYQAREIQYLEEQRKALRATMPLKLVS